MLTINQQSWLNLLKIAKISIADDMLSNLENKLEDEYFKYIIAAPEESFQKRGKRLI